MLVVVEIYTFVQFEKLAFFEAFPIYLILLLLSVYDYFIGRKNLKYEGFDIEISEAEIDGAITVMEHLQKWQNIKKTDNRITALSFNTKNLWLPVRVEIIHDKHRLEIASFLEPNFVQSNISTHGERKQNIQQFLLAIQLLKEGKSTATIPDLIKAQLEKEEWTESEFSLKNMTKRFLAYLVILGFFFLPYLFKNSELFYPFLIFPLFGIFYLVLDWVIIYKKV